MKLKLTQETLLALLPSDLPSVEGGMSVKMSTLPDAGCISMNGYTCYSYYSTCTRNKLC